MVLLHLASDEVPPRPIAKTARAFHCPSIAASVLLADGAVVSAGVVFLALLLDFDFVFFFGVVGSAAGA
jgi:hypothetical protein